MIMAKKLSEKQMQDAYDRARVGEFLAPGMCVDFDRDPPFFPMDEAEQADRERAAAAERKEAERVAAIPAPVLEFAGDQNITGIIGAASVPAAATSTKNP
jgi:hypothetical protein